MRTYRWQSKTHFSKTGGLDNLLLGGKQLKYFNHETVHEDGYFFFTIFESEINYFIFHIIQYGVLDMELIIMGYSNAGF